MTLTTLLQRTRPPRKSGKVRLVVGAIALLGAAAVGFGPSILGSIGRFPVHDDPPTPSDAVVVLYTGVEYYPRLIEAARLYNAGLAKTILLNGNRKTDVLRRLEKKGFVSCCDWSENYIRILGLLGVPRESILAVNAEDVYDTISEARAVGPVLLERGIQSILLTTSKSHTRRARHIWNRLFGDRLTIRSVAAESDPYDPEAWWRHGRQIRWVLAEYGAWLYYGWQML